MNLDDSYTRILDRTPVMPADEQAVVAARYARTRDPRDAQRLVLGNLRLVVKMAREIGPYRGDLMDLVQEGNAGLTYAVSRFDPKRGVKLTTYAAWWIRAYIMRHLMSTSRMVNIASTREGRRRFFDRTLPGLDRSFEAPGRTNNEGAAGEALCDLLADEEDRRPDVSCEETEYRARLHRAVEDFRPTLDPRDQAIFDMRLLCEKPAHLKAVGKRFAVSGERVRQLETRVRGDLRRHLAGALGEPERAAA
jgi:RNA polymerase sigma-32 factor